MILGGFSTAATMKTEPEKVKLGKGVSFFVKTRLRQLRQEDDTWEADLRALRIPIEWPPRLLQRPRPGIMRADQQRKRLGHPAMGCRGFGVPKKRGRKPISGILTLKQARPRCDGCSHPSPTRGVN
jgi:hypothetical protein